MKNKYFHFEKIDQAVSKEVDGYKHENFLIREKKIKYFDTNTTNQKHGHPNHPKLHNASALSELATQRRRR